MKGSKTVMSPSFIGIGAQRCGTTWLYECLAAHPDVFVSTPKELYFFTKDYSRGLDWYEAQFSKKGSARAWGEITPGYFYRPKALRRMARDVPDAKLFVILRNPIERALSAFDFFYESHYRGLDLREAMSLDPSILEQGMYSESLDRLFSLYPQKNCLVIFYDDITASPDTLVAALYEFVGVDATFRPAMLTRRVNQAILPRTQNILISLGMRRIIDRVKRSHLGEQMQAWHSRRLRRVRRDDSQNRVFLCDYYREEIGRLQKRFGRDFSSWIT